MRKNFQEPAVHWVIVTSEVGDPELPVVRELLHDSGMSVSHHYEEGRSLEIKCVFSGTRGIGTESVRILHHYCARYKAATDAGELLLEKEML